MTNDLGNHIFVTPADFVNIMNKDIKIHYES